MMWARRLGFRQKIGVDGAKHSGVQETPIAFIDRKGKAMELDDCSCKAALFEKGVQPRLRRLGIETRCTKESYNTSSLDLQHLILAITFSHETQF